MVREKFTRQHEATIKSAYEAVGKTAPNYAHMGRGQAVAAVAQFAADGGSGEALRLLRDGLIGLDPVLIPNTWV